jgi:hypothetical protein
LLIKFQAIAKINKQNLYFKTLFLQKNLCLK